MEVPEISEGLIEIVNVSREPGNRSKIAVRTKDKDIDPVGACVGMRGSRVQSVVQELKGERIDIVPYSDDPVKFVCSALSPAKVDRVLIYDDNHSIEVIVPDDQLSLAIGKSGQNVRLAARLTGWKIDVKSETMVSAQAEGSPKDLMRLQGMDESLAEKLFKEGFKSISTIASADTGSLAAVPGVEEKNAQAWIEEAGKIMAGESGGESA
jgi:N utilization substance protein A